MKNLMRYLMFGLMLLAIGLIGSCSATPLSFSPSTTPTAVPITKTKIAFTATDSKWQFEGIYTVYSDGTALKQLSKKGVQPAWSPSGAQLALSYLVGDRQEIWVLDPDGGNARPVVPQEVPGRQEAPTWSPDGKQIAFVTGNPAPTSPQPLQSIFVLSLESGKTIQIPCLAFSECSHPSWSPDGSQIVFTSQQVANSGEPIDIYVADTSSASKPRLVQENADTPFWQPHGELIAFHGEHEGKRGIFLMNPYGEILRMVKSDATDREIPDIAWSPDGMRLAFGRGDIYIIDADGSNLFRLTDSPDSNDSAPSWSPDGQQIAFQSYQAEHTEIYIVNADGTNLRQLTNSPENKFNPVWSPK